MDITKRNKREIEVYKVTEEIRAIYDWRDAKTNWRKCFRIILKHKFFDIKSRGFSALEIAGKILELHEKELDKEELKYLKRLVK